MVLIRKKKCNRSEGSPVGGFVCLLVYAYAYVSCILMRKNDSGPNRLNSQATYLQPLLTAFATCRLQPLPTAFPTHCPTCRATLMLSISIGSCAKTKARMSLVISASKFAPVSRWRSLDNFLLFFRAETTKFQRESAAEGATGDSRV